MREKLMGVSIAEAVLNVSGLEDYCLVGCDHE
jgi:hypothetical protein